MTAICNPCTPLTLQPGLCSRAGQKLPLVFLGRFLGGNLYFLIEEKFPGFKKKQKQKKIPTKNLKHFLFAKIILIKKFQCLVHILGFQKLSPKSNIFLPKNGFLFLISAKMNFFPPRKMLILVEKPFLVQKKV